MALFQPSVKRSPTIQARYRLNPDPYSSHSVIVSRLGTGEGKRLLDVGSADGYLAEILSARGYEVTCVEGDPALAARAVGKCRHVIVANLDHELPRLSGPFDAIVYGDVLEHLRDPLRVFSALNQHLRNDGIVCVSVGNVAHLWVRMQLLMGRFEYTERGLLDRTHLRFFTLRSFLQFLRDAEMNVIELLTTPAPLPLVVSERFHGRWLRALHSVNAWAARLWKPMFAYQFVAVAKRAGAP
jgi:2-polyprenyl-3-methyl-5-hydroxy-6-metoxy-1,4-benzoquinol methylase